MTDRYFVDGGVDNNWGTTGNWSLISGGAGGETVPTAADAVFLDANSPNCTLNTSARSALSLDCTGYTGTLTFSQLISVSGSITLASGMTFAGASALVSIAAGTLTSNGKTCGVPLTFQATVTRTLADDWTCSALVTVANGGNAAVINGNNLYCQAGLRLGSAAGTGSGTTVFHITGAGTLDAPSVTSGRFLSPLVINAPGAAITITSNFPCDMGQVQLLAAGSITSTKGAWTLGSAGGLLRHPGMSGGLSA